MDTEWKCNFSANCSGARGINRRFPNRLKERHLHDRKVGGTARKRWSGTNLIPIAACDGRHVVASDGGLTCEKARTRLRTSEENRMAKLALIYGMRLLPEEELGEVKDATVVLKNGRSARVTMHLIEGSKEEIENTFRQSIEAFFEMYPEI